MRLFCKTKPTPHSMYCNVFIRWNKLKISECINKNTSAIMVCKTNKLVLGVTLKNSEV